MGISEFRKKHEELVKKIMELKGKNCTPIPDGVIDIESYFNSETKILWINKEVNSLNDDHNWSLIDVLFNLKKTYEESSGWSKTFDLIIYTLYGIFNKTNWENTPNIKDNPQILEIIRNIAYINAKKLPGGPVANHKEVTKYSNENDIVKNQIKLFNPDVIICGGTFDIMDTIFEEIYGDSYDKMEQIPNTPKNRIYYNDKLIIFEAYYPAYRKGKVNLNKSDYCDSISQNVILWNNEKRLK